MKIIATILILLSSLFADSNNAKQNNPQEMIDFINQGISMSCNINMDFLSDITPMYQSSIDFSTLYLDKAKNEVLKEIAQRIIDKRSDEIEYFKELEEEVNKEKKDCDNTTYKEIQNKKQAAIEDSAKEIHKIQLTGNPDSDFAKMIIEDNKSLINNAKIILKYTNNNKIKDIANNIIQTQSDEIEQIQKAMK